MVKNSSLKSTLLYRLKKKKDFWGVLR